VLQTSHLTVLEQSSDNFETKLAGQNGNISLVVVANYLIFALMQITNTPKK